MMWIFGADRIWAEVLRGAQLRPWRFFYYSAKYIAPLILAFVLGFWVWLNIITPILNGSILQQGVEGQGTGWIVWVTRVFLLALFIGMCVMVRVAFKRRQEEATV
jgi:NSS family neurotransmitter:Na+ symporter